MRKEIADMTCELEKHIPNTSLENKTKTIIPMGTCSS
jgi:hypothetical protein